MPRRGETAYPSASAYAGNDGGRAYFSDEDDMPPVGRRGGQRGQPSRFDEEDLPPGGRHTARPRRPRQTIIPEFSDEHDFPAGPRATQRAPPRREPGRGAGRDTQRGGRREEPDDVQTFVPPPQRTIENGNSRPGRSHGEGAMITTAGPTSRAPFSPNTRQLQLKKGQPPRSRAGVRHENHTYDPTEALRQANPSPVPGQLHLHIYSFSQAIGCPCERRAPDTQLLAVIDCTPVRAPGSSYVSGRNEVYKDYFLADGRNWDFFRKLTRDAKEFILSREGIQERWAIYIGDWDGKWGSVAIADELARWVKTRCKSVSVVVSCEHLDLVRRGVGQGR